MLDQQITKSHSFKKLADDRAAKNPSAQKNEELQKLVSRFNDFLSESIGK